MIKIPRLHWHKYFMLYAHLAATRSTCSRGPRLLFDPTRKGVGAVIARGHQVVSTGYNGSAPGHPHCSDVRVGHMMVDGHCRRTIHAEENALIQCSQGSGSPVDANLYTTAAPCWDCAKRIVRSGIKEVFCPNPDHAGGYGLSPEAQELLRESKIPVVYIDVTDDVEGLDDPNNEEGSE